MTGQELRRLPLFDASRTTALSAFLYGGVMPGTYYVYIMSNMSKRLYIGVTNDLERRVWEHRAKQVRSFTKRYNLTMLVHMEEYPDPRSAIEREKELKGWLRSRKITLIEEANPRWLDLAANWFSTDRWVDP